jgi:6-pyruvoyltetrahydropterin/6-carboxytetrahydropterin synthase
MYEVSVRGSFSSAHHLRGYEGSCEAPHGHNWDVEVSVRGGKLDSLGMLVDFKEVRAAIRDGLEELDHKDLNLVPGFKRMNPTSENLARYIFERLSERINRRGLRVAAVRVHETAGASAQYWKDRVGE